MTPIWAQACRLLTVVASAILAACGGGGSSNDSGAPPVPGSPSAPGTPVSPGSGNPVSPPAVPTSGTLSFGVQGATALAAWQANGVSLGIEVKDRRDWSAFVQGPSGTEAQVAYNAASGLHLISHGGRNFYVDARSGTVYGDAGQVLATASPSPAASPAAKAPRFAASDPDAVDEVADNFNRLGSETASGLAPLCARVAAVPLGGPPAAAACGAIVAFVGSARALLSDSKGSSTSLESSTGAAAFEAFSRKSVVERFSENIDALRARVANAGSGLLPAAQAVSGEVWVAVRHKLYADSHPPIEFVEIERRTTAVAAARGASLPPGRTEVPNDNACISQSKTQPFPGLTGFESYYLITITNGCPHTVLPAFCSTVAGESPCGPAELVRRLGVNEGDWFVSNDTTLRLEPGASFDVPTFSSVLWSPACPAQDQGKRVSFAVHRDGTTKCVR